MALVKCKGDMLVEHNAMDRTAKGCVKVNPGAETKVDENALTTLVLSPPSTRDESPPKCSAQMARTSQMRKRKFAFSYEVPEEIDDTNNLMTKAPSKGASRRSSRRAPGRNRKNSQSFDERMVDPELYFTTGEHGTMDDIVLKPVEPPSPKKSDICPSPRGGDSQLPPKALSKALEKLELKKPYSEARAHQSGINQKSAPTSNIGSLGERTYPSTSTDKQRFLTTCKNSRPTEIPKPICRTLISQSQKVVNQRTLNFPHGDTTSRAATHPSANAIEKEKLFDDNAKPVCHSDVMKLALQHEKSIGERNRTVNNEKFDKGSLQKTTKPLLKVGSHMKKPTEWEIQKKDEKKNTPSLQSSTYMKYLVEKRLETTKDQRTQKNDEENEKLHLQTVHKAEKPTGQLVVRSGPLKDEKTMQTERERLTRLAIHTIGHKKPTGERLETMKVGPTKKEDKKEKKQSRTVGNQQLRPAREVWDTLKFETTQAKNGRDKKPPVQVFEANKKSERETQYFVKVEGTLNKDGKKATSQLKSGYNGEPLRERQETLKEKLNVEERQVNKLSLQTNVHQGSGCQDTLSDEDTQEEDEEEYELTEKDAEKKLFLQTGSFQVEPIEENWVNLDDVKTHEKAEKKVLPSRPDNREEKRSAERWETLEDEPTQKEEEEKELRGGRWDFEVDDDTRRESEELKELLLQTDIHLEKSMRECWKTLNNEGTQKHPEGGMKQPLPIIQHQKQPIKEGTSQNNEDTQEQDQETQDLNPPFIRRLRARRKYSPRVPDQDSIARYFALL